ncbi:PAS domain S-box protein [Pedobacter frigoris]|uniref:histidine kinase n=1 Tax=Pedobacter frigoris TaxID=2571272 RepID=A0A4U1CN68_9SPHI|nr:PAS domain S-box protein [Pedobacter frigoris]TKC08883.1 PAS domain S-box protein [Pedobacter frigoris]
MTHQQIKSNRTGPYTLIPDFEQQLFLYQKRISNILESFTDAFFEVDSDWTVTYWNKEAERLLLMPRTDIIGRNLWEVYADAIPLKFYTEYHTAMTQNVSVRFEEFFPARQIWFEVTAFPTGNGLSVYFKDITPSKNATTLLEQEKQKYIDLFNLSPVPQWVYDFKSLKFLDVNEAAINHYGYTRKEFLSMTIKDIRPAEDASVLDDTLCTNVIPDFFNKSSVRHKKKNGEIVFVCVEGNSVNFEGKDAGMVMVIDRTTELEAAKALQESLKRFETVSKATSDAIWDWNILTGEMIWNQGIKGIFGHKKTCCTEQWWQEHVHPEDLEKVLQKFDSLIKNQKTRLKMEYRFQCADGSYRFVLDRAFIIFNAAGMPIRIIGSMQDITDRMNYLEAIEIQNRRLREISWIQSHKVRSPLAKILGLVALINESKTDLQAINELIPMLQLSADELDLVVKEILQKTE